MRNSSVLFVPFLLRDLVGNGDHLFKKQIGLRSPGPGL